MITGTCNGAMGADFLYEVMAKQVGSEDVYFEFVVQLQTDPVKMPIEDSLVNWDESLSPFQRVALIRIPKQNIDAEGRMAIAKNQTFSPWHSLPEHRSLASINHSRRVLYELITDFRRKTKWSGNRRANCYSLVKGAS